MILAPPSGFEAISVLSAGPAAVTFEVRAIGPSAMRCVCKRLSARALQDAEATRAMNDEGAVLGALMGRGAPALIDRGEDARGPYVVMERVVFPTLRAHMSAGASSPAWIAQSARAAFACLARVHEADDAAGALAVVHADISPGNVAIAVDAAEAKLLDFGLAYFRDAVPKSASAFRGTIAYAAPELARGEPIDVRADLFALAASLLHAASGITPRADGHPAALLLAAAESPVDAWASAAAIDLPEALRHVLLRCVAFAKEDRPASAAHAQNSW